MTAQSRAALMSKLAANAGLDMSNVPQVGGWVGGGGPDGRTKAQLLLLPLPLRCWSAACSGAFCTPSHARAAADAPAPALYKCTETPRLAAPNATVAHAGARAASRRRRGRGPSAGAGCAGARQPHPHALPATEEHVQPRGVSGVWVGGCGWVVGGQGHVACSAEADYPLSSMRTIGSLLPSVSTP